MNWVAGEGSLDWVCGGVDPHIAGNGGPDCVSFLSPFQRTMETLLITAIGVFEMIFCWKYLDVPSSSYFSHSNDRKERTVKKVLLVLLCITFGIEIGLKFASRTIIYLLNPCHVLTIVQIYLLSAPPSKTVLVVFRLHMAALHGPFLALIFPVLNTRLLPCEIGVYWMQHILIYFIIPPYLLKVGGAYTVESLGNFSWCIFGTGFMFLYHFIFLQSLGMLLQVNLNNMICPATSDPFYGQWYRLWALLHQHALVPVHLKIYTCIFKLLIPTNREVCNGAVVNKDD